MTKVEIISALKTSYINFDNTVEALSDKDLMYAPPEKWTVAQQYDHLCRSTKPLILATTLPHFLLQIIFGKANRPSRTNKELVEKYLMKLQQCYTATGNYIPPVVYADQRHFLRRKLTRIISSICKNLDKFSEEDLDKFILPHPLLGKLTMREMMYFTIYHAQHHENIVKGYFA